MRGSCLIYARAKTEEGKDAQIRELTSVARQLKLQVMGVYFDVEQSGPPNTPPGLRRMMSRIRRRCVEAVLMTSVDRLGRNPVVRTKHMIDLNKLGVAVVTVGSAEEPVGDLGRIVDVLFQRLPEEAA